MRFSLLMEVSIELLWVGGLPKVRKAIQAIHVGTQKKMKDNTIINSLHISVLYDIFCSVGNIIFYLPGLLLELACN